MMHMIGMMAMMRMIEMTAMVGMTRIIEMTSGAGGQESMVWGCKNTSWVQNTGSGGGKGMPGRVNGAVRGRERGF